MQQFVLGAVFELVRVMEHLPMNFHECSSAQNLKFKIANRLCSAHHARWDLFALVSGIMFKLMKYIWMDKLIAYFSPDVLLASGPL